MAADGVPWARVPHGRWPPRKPRAGNAALDHHQHIVFFQTVPPSSPFGLYPRPRLSGSEVRGTFANWVFQRICPGNLLVPFSPLSPQYQVGRSWGGAGQVPRACRATQEAEISTGRSGKLTVSWPFASVLIYLAFYRLLCFIACREFGRSQGSLSSRQLCNSCNNHDSRSS